MDDETWLRAERAKPGPSPSCEAYAARPIRYGMPTGEGYGRLSGRVMFAGCCLPEVLHRWSCGGCGAEWGHVQWDEPEEPARSVFDGLDWPRRTRCRQPILRASDREAQALLPARRRHALIVTADAAAPAPHVPTRTRGRR